MKPIPYSLEAYEAKTRLEELLEQVIQGSSFIITKHEHPVARLVGIKSDLSAQRAEATVALRILRARYCLGGIDTKSICEEGRM